MNTNQLNSASRPRRAPDCEPALSRATAPAPGKPLSGSLVELVKVDVKAQAQSLFDLSKNHNSLWDYMKSGPFSDVDSMTKWMAECSTTTNPLFYTFIDTTTGAPFGMASYMNIIPENGSIEIGNIWITPNAQRTTMATQALYLMMAHAMDDLKFRRLEWKCNALNAPSRTAAKRFGFSYEGTFFNHLIIKGKNRDTAWFSITTEEWPAIKANFERWLAPDNFDETGKQKTSLADLNWE